MKEIISIPLLLLLGGALMAAPGVEQPGAGGLGSLHSLAPGTPRLSANFAKLFGDNTAFSATMQSEVIRAAQSFTSTAKIMFLEGKSRMEIDVSKNKGASLPPGAVENLRSFGLSEMVLISLPAKKTLYIIYPTLQAYTEVSNQTDQAGVKLDTTELGEETLDGHPCVKNKVALTSADGKTEEAVLWNATDLKKFPVKIETADETAKAAMTFSDVKFERPAASLFAPPADYVKYDSFHTLVQESVIKQRMHGGRVLPKP